MLSTFSHPFDLLPLDTRNHLEVDLGITKAMLQPMERAWAPIQKLLCNVTYSDEQSSMVAAVFGEYTVAMTHAAMLCDFLIERFAPAAHLVPVILPATASTFSVLPR